MAEHTVDNRAVDGSSPSGCIGRVHRILGRWCSRITCRVFNPEMESSNLSRPIESWGTRARWSGRNTVYVEIEGSSPFVPVFGLVTQLERVLAS